MTVLTASLGTPIVLPGTDAYSLRWTDRWTSTIICVEINLNAGALQQGTRLCADWSPIGDRPTYSRGSHYSYYVTSDTAPASGTANIRLALNGGVTNGQNHSHLVSDMNPNGWQPIPSSSVRLGNGQSALQSEYASTALYLVIQRPAI